MADPAIREQVEQAIRDNDVLLFMKGTPDAPRCGFSMRVVGVLGEYGVEYGAIDVLPALEPLREATGEIADWRTFPQLYVKGELVGGADIVQELAASGELEATLNEKLGETWRRPGEERTVAVTDGPGLRVVPGG
jgi:monothiol glutaredoxin